jgi:hypothetical protein
MKTLAAVDIAGAFSMRPECTLAVADFEPSLKNLASFADLSSGVRSATFVPVAGWDDGIVNGVAGVSEASMEDSSSDMAVKQASVRPLTRCFLA